MASAMIQNFIQWSFAIKTTKYPDLEQSIKGGKEYLTFQNGKREDLYVTNIKHDSIFRIKAKSKFIPKVNQPPEYGYDPEKLCKNSRYGNILYDKYRDVYYRISYPKNNID